MKKIFLLPFIFVFLFSVSSCETEDSLDPRPVIVNGQYVRLDITKKVLTYDHPESAVFGGVLSAPGGNVKRFELFVRRSNSFQITPTNYVKMNIDVQSFPYQLEITPQMIADALQIPVSDLKLDDTYRFLGYSYGQDGTVMGYNNLSATVKTQPGMKQAYKFMTAYLNDASIGGFFTDGILVYDNYQL